MMSKDPSKISAPGKNMMKFRLKDNYSGHMPVDKEGNHDSKKLQSLSN